MTRSRIIVSEHARWQASRRGLKEAVVLRIARSPGHVIPVRPGREIRQSIVAQPPHSTKYLVRVVVDVSLHTAEIVTRARHKQDQEILEGTMKVNYDSHTDTLTVILRNAAVAESDESKPEIILDYDKAGNLISLEVLDASKRVEEPASVTMAAQG